MIEYLFSLLFLVFFLNTGNLYAADKKSEIRQRPPSVVEVGTVTQGKFIDALTHCRHRSLTIPFPSRLSRQHSFENVDGTVTPGMHAKIRVINEIEKAPIVPYDAVVKNLRTGEANVFAVEGNVAWKVGVTVLAFTDKVQAGDKVVVIGNEGLSDGSAVSIASALP